MLVNSAMGGRWESRDYWDELTCEQRIGGERAFQAGHTASAGAEALEPVWLD